MLFEVGDEFVSPLHVSRIDIGRRDGEKVLATIRFVDGHETSVITCDSVLSDLADKINEAHRRYEVRTFCPA